MAVERNGSGLLTYNICSNNILRSLGVDWFYRVCWNSMNQYSKNNNYEVKLPPAQEMKVP